MDLGDGCGGKGGRDILERCGFFAKCLGQKTGHQLFVERGQRILQGGEVGGDFKADDVAAGGKNLTELDIDRAEPGQRVGEPRDAACLAHVALFDQPRDTDHELGGRRNGMAFGERERALAGQNEAGPCEP